MNRLFHLLQFTDSAFPVGTFSFSNGLETAAQLGLVSDAVSLAQYAASAARQAAFTDGVAGIAAFRAACTGDYVAVCAADRRLMLFKLNEEGRLMLTRMGRKLAELGSRLFGADNMLARWLADIGAGATPGSYPVAQGIAFALAGLDEEDFFTAHQYGVINMILSAALRLLRVSHYDTQQILFCLAGQTEDLYRQAKGMGFENMNAFVPEMDVLASLHEKGTMRMFMN